MVERAILLVVAIAVVGAGWVLLRWLLAIRFAQIAQQPPASVLSAVLEPNVPLSPTLLYFTTDDCAQCRFQQAPILERLASATLLSIVKVNTIENQELARHYGILTVPSTVLLDPKRKAVAINHGLANFDKLRLQVGSMTEHAV